MSSACPGDSEAGTAAEDRGGQSWWLGLEVAEVGLEGVVDLAGDVAPEAAHDLALGLSFHGPAFDVCASAGAVAQLADCDEVKRPVGLTVTA